MTICRCCGLQVERKWPARLCDLCKADAERSYGGTSGVREASKAVTRAILRGELETWRGKKCVDCGADAYGYEHRDYNQPLNVVPICRSCNKKRGPAIPLRVSP